MLPNKSIRKREIDVPFSKSKKKKGFTIYSKNRDNVVKRTDCPREKFSINPKPNLKLIEAENNNLRKLVENFKIEQKDLQSKITYLRDDNESLKKDNRSLKDDVESHQKNNQKLKEEIVSLQEKNSILLVHTIKKDSLEEVCSNLYKKVCQSDAHAAELRLYLEKSALSKYEEKLKNNLDVQKDNLSEQDKLEVEQSLRCLGVTA